MRLILGSVRILISVVVLVIGALLIMALVWVPVKVRGIRLAPWLANVFAQWALVVFNVRRQCATPEAVQNHRGLIFPNHISYFDILVLFSLNPLRFLSTYEIRTWPFIGLVSIALGTIFVNRSDKGSRLRARLQVAEAVSADPYPPLVIFPEGGVGPGRTLKPFHYGAFEIAVERHIAFLPCAIEYSHPEIIVWGQKESFLTAFWRLVCATESMTVTVTPLTAVQPKIGDDAKALAKAAYQQMASVLKVEMQM